LPIKGFTLRNPQKYQNPTPNPALAGLKSLKFIFKPLYFNKGLKIKSPAKKRGFGLL
jgi:hypothetical protein